MKIMTILGTRPEIIRLSRIIPKLDELSEHVLVHTGQNYDRNLNEVFFKELGLRNPDYVLSCKSGTLFGQIALILQECEKVLVQEKPDRLLLLGDTNSALSAIIAKRLGIPVFHMEAGNRCFDDRVPEEVNRRIVDHCSDILLPYTERSRAHLLKEGFPDRRVYVTGNPIYEVLNHYSSEIEKSDVLGRHSLQTGKYFLVTLHRSENVDIKERLEGFIAGLERIASEYRLPVVCSLHPRTKSQLDRHSKAFDHSKIVELAPLGFFDFVKLEKNALCVLSDSGTVQEECCIFDVPSVTLRDVTERPETLEAGSNLLSGAEADSIVSCVKQAIHCKTEWKVPPEYLQPAVSNTVVRMILSHWERLR